MACLGPINQKQDNRKSIRMTVTRLLGLSYRNQAVTYGTTDCFTFTHRTGTKSISINSVGHGAPDRYVRRPLRCRRAVRSSVDVCLCSVPQFYWTFSFPNGICLRICACWVRRGRDPASGCRRGASPLTRSATGGSCTGVEARFCAVFACEIRAVRSVF